MLSERSGQGSDGRFSRLFERHAPIRFELDTRATVGDPADTANMVQSGRRYLHPLADQLEACCFNAGTFGRPIVQLDDVIFTARSKSCELTGRVDAVDATQIGPAVRPRPRRKSSQRKVRPHSAALRRQLFPNR